MELSGDSFINGPPAVYRASYYISREDGAVAAVREVRENSGRSSRKIYRGVESFAIRKLAAYPGMFEVSATLGRETGNLVLRRAVLVPAGRRWERHK